MLHLMWKINNSEEGVVIPLRKKYPLQIAISTLFIAITVSLAIILSWQSFNKTSDIMLKSADDLYGRITQELILDFKATYGSIAGGIRQFRLSPVIYAETFEQRIESLPNFQAVLESDTSVFAVGIGYGDGDYLGFSSVNSDYVREKYETPAGSSFIALYIKNAQAKPDSDAIFEAGKLYTIFYDEKLNEISRSQGVATQFDPRVRPWYQQATDTPHATKPYLFYDSKVVGLTAMSKTAVPGVVVVFDITLAELSRTIAKHQVTPGSEVVLINADGQTLAYKDQQKIIVSSDESSDPDKIQLANLKQLGSGVLSYLSTFVEKKEQNFDFEYSGQRWIGSARIVAKTGGVDLYALMLTPVDELLVDAVAIREHLIFIAFVVLLMFIPIIWYTAQRISKPLRVHTIACSVARGRSNFPI